MKLKYNMYNLRSGVQKVKTRTALALSAVVLAVASGGGMTLAVFGTSHAATPWYVSSATVGGGSCASPDFNSVSAAVAGASSGDTVVVCDGTYNESVTVDKALTIEGFNNAGVSGRSASRGAESVINGLVTVDAADVALDGLSFTNQNASGSTEAVLMKTSADNAMLKNSIVENVSSAGNVQAVYLQHGPDNVTIMRNAIRDVSATGASAKAIYLGDSSANDGSDNVVIRNNAIYRVTSDTKGAYGIEVNSGSGSGTAVTNDLLVKNNSIRNLTGGWVHSVGLEADTPNVVVEHNTFGKVTSGSLDAVNVWFENENTAFESAMVNYNNFNRTDVYGIAVQQPGGDSLDGTCNYWGDPSGPSGEGSGTGAAVSPLVNFQPWLIARNGECSGGFAQVKADCMNDGWMNVVRDDQSTFKNQGLCVAYTNHMDNHGNDGAHAKMH